MRKNRPVAGRCGKNNIASEECGNPSIEPGTDVAPEEKLINIVFVVVTGLVAWHGLTYRDKDGERTWVHLLFGCIALLYCLWVLGSDILGLF